MQQSVDAAPDVRLLEVMQAPKRRPYLPARYSLSVAVDPDCQNCLQEGKLTPGKDFLCLYANCGYRVDTVRRKKYSMLLAQSLFAGSVDQTS